MIRTATLNPSFAPSTSDSYTLTPLAQPNSTSEAISAGSTQKESIPRNTSPLGTVFNERIIWRQTAPKKRRQKRGTPTKRQRGGTITALGDARSSEAFSNPTSVSWSEISWEVAASVFSPGLWTWFSFTKGGAFARKRGS